MNKMSSSSSKRGMRIFKMADAEDFQESGMTNSDYSPAVMEHLKALRDAGYGDGSRIKVLCRGADNEPSLLHVWFKSNFPLPLHNHTHDCLYYIVAGELKMGTETLRAGDGFFLPDASNYSYTAGPEGVELLEFRSVSRCDTTLMEGTPAAWQRMATIAAANRDKWKTEELPVRR